VNIEKLVLNSSKISRGSVLVPDPLLFEKRDDAIFFGDSKSISKKISDGNMPEEKANFIYPKLDQNKNKKYNGR